MKQEKNLTTKNPSQPSLEKGRGKVAFTLAEVLITLGIIGVVAALTMPVITANIQKIVFKNQFKKFYSMFYQAISQAQTNNGGPFACYYWDTGELCKGSYCAERNEDNTCKRWLCGDGSPLPANNTGNFQECEKFEQELFNKTLKTVKFCQDKALERGCLTDSYRGTDIAITSSDTVFLDNRLKNTKRAWVLNDGTLIMHGSGTLYAVDVNGHKGPNKWGCDIITLGIRGNEAQGQYKIVGQGGYAEKGCTNSKVYIDDAFLK